MTEYKITNKVRQLRFGHGEMTQAQLAKKIGMTRQTVAAIEQGKYTPSLEAAFRIAEAFDETLGAVFQRNSESIGDEQA